MYLYKSFLIKYFFSYKFNTIYIFVGIFITRNSIATKAMPNRWLSNNVCRYISAHSPEVK